ncbi:hypothetical protein ACFLR1_04860 [Bacteroidota bacterium]
MKKYLLALTIPFLMSTQTVSAQAWTKNTNVISVGLGASSFYHFDKTYRNSLLGFGRATYAPVTGQINVDGEFGVHEYIGVGFSTGLGGRAGLFTGYNGSFNIPLAAVANFHFYQLIQDKTGANLHADVLDIYAGANLGTGIAFVFYNSGTVAAPLVYGGVHVGIRWYFVENIGLTGQFGFGRQLANIGVAFKL